MSDIYLSLTETPSVVTLSQPVISGALSSTVTVANTVTVALDANSLSALENVTVTVGAAISGTVTVANFPASQTVQGTVTVGSLPAISGSVTINNFPSMQIVGGNVSLAYGEEQIGYVTIDQQGAGAVPVSGTITVGNSVTISGTVTANAQGTVTAGMLLVENANNSFPNQNAPVQLKANPLNGSLRVRMDYSASADPSENGSSVVGNTNATEIGTLSYIKARVVAGSVTIGANPSGALTTRFGSVTTANTAQITSAVTNASRKYLLAQNISAGTVTIGIGFSPTTTQGIQLTAGAGLTFDSFCPTGAVFWLGAVTGAAFTILEG